jgi:hypothetical protein
MKAEVTIGPMHGPVDPPPIAITFKVGNRRIRVELRPEDFALAVTGRLVFGEVTSSADIFFRAP